MGNKAANKGIDRINIKFKLFFENFATLEKLIMFVLRQNYSIRKI